MRYVPFGVSNIAWPGAELDEALGLLSKMGCTAVEIAPFNVFQRWDGIDEPAKRLRDRIERHGLVCSALQGILYNVPQVELFTNDGTRVALLRHLESVARLAGTLGAKACVFGAPKQRDPGELPYDKAWAIAVETFRAAGPVFAAFGSALAFEANAGRYGCRFVRTTAEAAKLVAAVNSPGIGLQIDTGTLFLEGENPSVLTQAAPFAVHCHVSEPDLRAPGMENHDPIAAGLRRSQYAGSLSVEMRLTDDWRVAIPQAIRFVRSAYT